MARLKPIEHKKGGYCYKCKGAIHPGTLGYWDNGTKCRMHQRCGDVLINEIAAFEEQKKPESQRHGPVTTKRIDESAASFERVEMDPQALRLIEEKLDAIRQVVGALALDMAWIKLQMKPSERPPRVRIPMPGVNLPSEDRLGATIPSSSFDQTGGSPDAVSP